MKHSQFEKLYNDIDSFAHDEKDSGNPDKRKFLNGLLKDKQTLDNHLFIVEYLERSL